jgi:hypothetical protein
LSDHSAAPATRLSVFCPPVTVTRLSVGQPIILHPATATLHPATALPCADLFWIFVGSRTLEKDLGRIVRRRNPSPKMMRKRRRPN